jgi:hypothetical protein
LYGCETFSLVLREKHRQEMLKNMGLREDAGLKRGEVIREDHIKGASSSIPITKYYSADQIKKNDMD